ncbi:hypothetical protein TNCV_4098321 [Trichonephila clavipes]|nr:hypothetical protein TNCV_4098321 [Trichonephila clavipes]
MLGGRDLIVETDERACSVKGSTIKAILHLPLEELSWTQVRVLVPLKTHRAEGPMHVKSVETHRLPVGVVEGWHGGAKPQNQIWRVFFNINIALFSFMRALDDAPRNFEPGSIDEDAPSS